MFIYGQSAQPLLDVQSSSRSLHHANAFPMQPVFFPPLQGGLLQLYTELFSEPFSRQKLIIRTIIVPGLIKNPKFVQAAIACAAVADRLSISAAM